MKRKQNEVTKARVDREYDRWFNKACAYWPMDIPSTKRAFDFAYKAGFKAGFTKGRRSKS